MAAELLPTASIQYLMVTRGGSKNPGIELQPEQTLSQIEADRNTWNAMVNVLYQESMAMLRAVHKHDADAVFDNGEALEQACEVFHRHFWYPENAADFSP